MSKILTIALATFSLTAFAETYSRIAVDVSALPKDKQFLSEIVKKRVEARTSVSDRAGRIAVVFRLEGKKDSENAAVKVADGKAIVTSGRFRGLVYGAGVVLRTINYGKESFSLQDGDYRFEPKKELRMGYLARHNWNWYHFATAEELAEYVYDLVLSGLNAFNFQYYYPELNVAEVSPEEVKRFEEISVKLFDRIHALDCGFCENGGSNQVPIDSPEEFRGVPNSDRFRGNAGVQCMSVQIGRYRVYPEGAQG